MVDSKLSLEGSEPYDAPSDSLHYCFCPASHPQVLFEWATVLSPMKSSAAISLFAPAEMSLNTSTSRSDRAGPSGGSCASWLTGSSSLVGYTRLNRGLASMHCPDGSEDLSWGRVLEQVGSGVGAQNIPNLGLNRLETDAYFRCWRRSASFSCKPKAACSEERVIISLLIEASNRNLL